MPPTPEQRFDDLYEREHAAVRAYAARRAGAEAADDVVAETFMVAWRTFDRLPDDARPWLFGIARNVLRQERRREDRQRAVAERLAAEPASGRAESQGDRRVLTALAALSERDREVVMLVCWEELDLKRAARVMGTSHVAARVRLHRARARLRVLLETGTTTAVEEPA